uniref:AP-1 complex subunit gamma-2, putative n=1 Tax=Arundo donax TaxID=35708 RepID=A0A0A9EVJ4_ARUDO
MMRSSSALERASPMDLTRSRNSLDCPHPPCDPIASSRPIVRSCSIATPAPVGGYLLGGAWGSTAAGDGGGVLLRVGK